MTRTVMVVDDSRFIFEQIKSMLENTEFEIIGYCMSAEDALEKYPELLPDIVTMDIILPGMDGLEASEELLKQHPEAKIVVVSSLSYDETEERAAELGIHACIFKPIEEDLLLEALRTLPL